MPNNQRSKNMNSYEQTLTGYIWDHIEKVIYAILILGIEET